MSGANGQRAGPSRGQNRNDQTLQLQQTGCKDETWDAKKRAKRIVTLQYDQICKGHGIERSGNRLNAAEMMKLIPEAELENVNLKVHWQ